MPPIHFKDRVFRFMESSLTQTLLGIVGGTVGTFLDGRYFIVLTPLVPAAFHRNKVLEGLGKGKSVAFYCVSSLLTASLLFWMGTSLNKSRPHTFTPADYANAVKGQLPLPITRQMYNIYNSYAGKSSASPAPTPAPSAQPQSPSPAPASLFPPSSPPTVRPVNGPSLAEQIDLYAGNVQRIESSRFADMNLVDQNYYRMNKLDSKLPWPPPPIQQYADVDAREMGTYRAYLPNIQQARNNAIAYLKLTPQQITADAASFDLANKSALTPTPSADMKVASSKFDAMAAYLTALAKRVQAYNQP
jgi:hypothetical protein